MCPWACIYYLPRTARKQNNLQTVDANTRPPTYLPISLESEDRLPKSKTSSRVVWFTNYATPQRVHPTPTRGGIGLQIRVVALKSPSERLRSHSSFSNPRVLDLPFLPCCRLLEGQDQTSHFAKQSLMTVRSLGHLLSAVADRPWMLFFLLFVFFFFCFFV